MQIIENAVYMGAATPGTGGAAVIDTLNVTPTTSAQTITAPEGVDGYSPVNVSAVTSAIDANIVAGNIKKDVSILGVTGSYEGQTPTGTMYIISNGTYNVADKAIANVNVPTTAPAHYVEKTVDANGKLLNSTNIINLNGVTDVGNGVLAYSYSGVSFPTNTNIDLSSLITISGQSACSNMFNGCTGLTSVDLSSLTTINGNFASQYMFGGCSSLTSVDLSSLITIRGSNACSGMFNGCTGLITAKLNALNTIDAPIAQNSGQMFGGCTKLESLEFGGLTASTFTSRKDQIAYLFNNTTGSQATNGCTVHFPSNFDPSDPDHTFDVTTLVGYPRFGGNASYIHVAFDLPATE